MLKYLTTNATLSVLLLVNLGWAADTVPPNAPGGFGIATGSTTIIPSQVCSGTSTGVGLVSSGFFFRPGDLFDTDLSARKLSVYVNNQEQAIYTEALRGRFPDGSIRSVLIQFDADIPSTTVCLPAEVRIGGSVNRGTTDIAKRGISEQVLRDQRVIIATNPTFLTATWATFQPLLPASQESAANRAYFTTLFDRQYEALKTTQLTSGNYLSTYESTRSLAAAWQKSANTKYYFNALTRAISLMEGYTLPDAATDTATFRPRLNPQGFPGIAGPGIPAEQHSQRYIGFAWAYLATGAIEYWNVVNAIQQSGMAGKSTQAIATALGGWIHRDYYGRFNLVRTWGSAVSVSIDTTAAINGTGTWGGGRRINFPVELPWILDAWDANRYTTSDYRAGLRGTSQTCTDGGKTPAGQLPHFQVALLSDFLVFYYLNVQADQRAADWACQNAAIVWDNNVQPQSSGQPGYPNAAYGYPYDMTGTPGKTGGLQPWTLPMWSATLAFCKHHTGQAKFGTYYQWASNPANVDSSHLTWSWKIFGESFGNVMMAPYLDQVGIPQNLPTSIRVPVQY